MAKYVLFGIRDDVLRSPFVAAFVEAESFVKAARKLAGTIDRGEHIGWRSYLRLSSLLPSRNIESQMFNPGPCTPEVLVAKDKDATTKLSRYQAMQFLRHQFDRTLGFVLVEVSE